MSIQVDGNSDDSNDSIDYVDEYNFKLNYHYIEDIGDYRDSLLIFNTVQECLSGLSQMYKSEKLLYMYV